MSRESLEQFYEVVAQDSALSSQLQSAPDQKSFLEQAVRLGEEKGYSFTTEEVKAAIESIKANQGVEELKDDQLEGVAGGKASQKRKPFTSMWTTFFTGDAAEWQ